MSAAVADALPSLSPFILPPSSSADGTALDSAVAPADSVVSCEQVRLVSAAVDPSAEARKRRREILASQRLVASSNGDAFSAKEMSPSVTLSTVFSSDDEVLPRTSKKLKVSETSLPPTISSSSSSSSSSESSSEDENEVKGTSMTIITKKKQKKPQMKYDPDVPMTKEEAASWRREQRRKRNRESAAASRQRQRDRIFTLEGEIDDWKTKYESVLEKIRELEELTACSATASPSSATPDDSQPILISSSNTPADSAVDITDSTTDSAITTTTTDDREITCFTPPPSQDDFSAAHPCVSPDLLKSLSFPPSSVAGEVYPGTAKTSSIVMDHHHELLDQVLGKEVEEGGVLPSKMISRPA